jgi:hypothetical protein
MSAGLLYFGTNVAVALGDLIEVKRWFRKPLRGRVSYLPGVSRPHPEMKIGDLEHWAIDLDDGSRRAWPYLPEQLQPQRSIKFIARGSDGFVGLTPDRASGMMTGVEPDTYDDE